MVRTRSGINTKQNDDVVEIRRNTKKKPVSTKQVGK